MAALVELKARFDESANVEWAKALETAGCHVVYGLVGLKVHTKCLLVVRDEPDGIRRYCHVGTGNYNPKTARLYEDLGLLTADPELGNDLTHLFNYLTGYWRDVEYRRLLVAPRSAAPGDQRPDPRRGGGRHRRGRIIMKMNSLVDTEMIDELYEASQAGVQIDLIVRGICCLTRACRGCRRTSGCARSWAATSSTPGSTTSPTASADGEGRYLIGSADLMPQPRSPGRGAGAGHRPRAGGPAAGGARPEARRRRAGLDLGPGGRLGAGRRRADDRDHLELQARTVGRPASPDRRLTPRAALAVGHAAGTASAPRRRLRPPRDRRATAATTKEAGPARPHAVGHVVAAGQRLGLGRARRPAGRRCGRRQRGDHRQADGGDLLGGGEQARGQARVGLGGGGHGERGDAAGMARPKPMPRGNRAGRTSAT